MTFGISRVHGAVASPKNLAGVALTDYTLTFAAAALPALNADKSLAGGALDQVFRTAVGTVASVSRIGTLNTATGVLNFAIETLGVEAGEAGYLGTGPTDANPATTALALQAAVQALGVVTNSVGGVIDCTSATVVAFTY